MIRDRRSKKAQDCQRGLGGSSANIVADSTGDGRGDTTDNGPCSLLETGNKRRGRLYVGSIICEEQMQVHRYTQTAAVSPGSKKQILTTWK